MAHAQARQHGEGEATRSVLRLSLTTRLCGPPYAKMVFFSHRGSGKSTELLCLKGELEGENRYRCLYLEANAEMDANTIEGEDLLLALAKAVDEFMRAQGLALPEEKLERVSSWFRDIVQTTEWGRTSAMERGVSLKVGADGKGPKIPVLGTLLANLNAITKHESKFRREVRQAFQREPQALLEPVNQLFDLANQLLQFHNRGELLVIIDNLDRYPPEVIDRLLVQGADRISELRCSLMFTPPISLHYRPTSISLRELYACEGMPAVLLRDPGDALSALTGPGRALLLQALGKRIDLSLIPEVAAQDRLVVASGGAMRDLLKLVQAAALRSDLQTITHKDVERAAGIRRAEMRDQINANGWAAALAGIRDRKQIDHADACQDVLYHRLAFKYNGGGWYDIHPLVDEIEEVTRLYQEPRPPSA